MAHSSLWIEVEHFAVSSFAVTVALKIRHLMFQCGKLSRKSEK
jgi:hypothetical protein